MDSGIGPLKLFPSKYLLLFYIIKNIINYFLIITKIYYSIIIK